MTCSDRFLAHYWLVGFGLLLAFAGCGKNHVPPPVSDPAKATESLKRTLDQWQTGATVESLRTAAPSIHAIDDDWLAGKKLLRYELTGAPQVGGVSQRFRAVLELESAGGPQRKPVEYIVTTEPVISVIRQDQAEGEDMAPGSRPNHTED